MSGLGGPLAPLDAEALIFNRDGIVGAWQSLTGNVPDNLNLENPQNLERWEPRVRDCIIDFEVHSRLSFTSDATGTGQMYFWHLEQAGSASSPSADYLPLIDIKRPSKEQFAKQLDFVAAYADLRPDRAAEIIAQLGGGLAFLCSVVYAHPNRTPWTLELLGAAVRLATHVEMRLKHALASRRAFEYSPQIQPMILTPSHSSFPSGHSTETFLAAYVLWRLLIDSGVEPYVGKKADWGTQLMSVAARVAINRTVAGVHFPVDSACGCVLGLTLGQYFVARCTRGTSYTAWRFDGTNFPALAGTTDAPPQDGDFYWTSLYDMKTLSQTEASSLAGKYAIKQTPDQTISAPAAGTETLLTKLWSMARAEWKK